MGGGRETPPVKSEGNLRPIKDEGMGLRTAREFYWALLGKQIAKLITHHDKIWDVLSLAKYNNGKVRRYSWICTMINDNYRD